ncbi:MAG: hypothetical protein ACK5LC_02765 [Coprobacillaceae bacterium]
MNKYQILAARFQGFSKYLRIIAIVSLVLYFIFAAISTGQSDMVFITYALLMICIISALQSIVLLVLSRIYQNKK